MQCPRALPAHPTLDSSNRQPVGILHPHTSVALSALRPWPDSSGPGGSATQLVGVHPASLPIPPLWVTQTRLSSGQQTVSCPPDRRTDAHSTTQHHGPSVLPLRGRRASSLTRHRNETRREGVCVAEFPSFSQFQAASVKLPSSNAANKVMSKYLSSLSFSHCLPSPFPIRVELLPRSTGTSHKPG